MLFPSEIIDKFDDTFYDKDLTILEIEKTLDEEGGMKQKVPKETGSFRGNVRFVGLGEIQEELGLVENIDICITTRPEVEIKLDNYVKYLDKIYQITDVIPSDSHQTITGKLWQA